MQVRRVSADERRIGSERLMDVLQADPLQQRKRLGELPRIGVAGAQRWPPVALQTLLEGPGVSRAEDVASDTGRVVGHTTVLPCVQVGAALLPRLADTPSSLRRCRRWSTTAPTARTTLNR